MSSLSFTEWRTPFRSSHSLTLSNACGNAACGFSPGMDGYSVENQLERSPPAQCIKADHNAWLRAATVWRNTRARQALGAAGQAPVQGSIRGAVALFIIGNASLSTAQGRTRVTDEVY